MITNTGKSIIAKYLLGQAPAYASYMAIGCGKKPLQTGDTAPDFSNQENLNFEMFRVPISSRGYVVEDNISKIVFTAELPTEERYEISEIGLYSASANPSANANDSKTIFAFTTTENWKKQNGTDIITISGPLDGSANNNVFETTESIFKSNADNRIFYNTNRASRYERCRYFNNIIALRGDTSDITISGGHMNVASDPEYIKITGVSLDFSKNTPSDEIRLAFSVVNKDGDAISFPAEVNVLIEFTGSDTSKFARLEANLLNGTGVGQQDFANNRYCVVTKQLQELYTTNTFTWDSVNTINAYCSVKYNGSVSEDFYVLLDALRFENVTTVNPLYGLTGYSIVQNDDASTIIKAPNTSNYVEFRFGVGVG
jgi:hypothetical protein